MAWLRELRAVFRLTRVGLHLCWARRPSPSSFRAFHFTGGARVLPFHAALFQAAIEAAVPVQPLALSYADRGGLRSRAATYDGEITLWQSLCALARASGFSAELRVLPALDVGLGMRGTLAQHCRAAIMLALGQRAIPAHGLACADEKPSDFVADLVTQPIH